MATSTDTKRDQWIIKPHPFHSPQAAAIVAKLDTELLAMYPDWEDLIHPNLKPNPIPDIVKDSNLEAHGRPNKPDDLAFLVAFSTVVPTGHPESAVGCIGLRERSQAPGLPLGVRIGEVKRMYVAPNCRGEGLAASLLQAMEKFAQDVLGLRRLVLEVGCRQVAAMKFYERNGWTKIPLYGEYVGAGVENGGVSICYEKELQ